MRIGLTLALAIAATACHEAPPGGDAVTTTAEAAQAASVDVVGLAEAEAAVERDRSAPVLVAEPVEAGSAGHAGASAADSARCLAQTGARVSREAQAIHRWVDAAGIVHYSDRAPEGRVHEHRRVALSGLPPVSVEATGHDVNLPHDVHARAVADALAIDRVLRSLFAADEDDRVALRVVFVASGEAYQRFIGEPVLARSAGAYSARERTVYVRTQADEATAFAVLRHEIVHALVHERIGNLPVALNEGLAGYFERFEAAGQGGRVDLGGLRARLSAAAPDDAAAALTELLALEGPGFYRSQPERRYAQALALVALLMRDPGGRAVLGDLLTRQRAQPCAPIAMEGVLDLTYPGGLSALAADLAGWMRAPGPASQTW